jgi:CheY-like chemotaxis protein
MDDLRILIVDDEEDLVAALGDRLEMRGFSVQVASSGAEALQHLDESEFDVAVVDIKMPQMDGLQLTEEIRRIHPELPVILLTGQSSAPEEERAEQLGAAGCLVKPIDIEQLIESLRNATTTGKG